MTDKIKIGLIFGGNSSEYEVSIMSAHNIYEEIDTNKFDVYPMWITNDGYLADDADSRKVLDNPKMEVANPHKVANIRSEEHTSELQSRFDLVCRLLLEKKN